MNRKNINPPLFTEEDTKEMIEAVEHAGSSARAAVDGWKNQPKKLGLTRVRSVRPFHILPRHAQMPSPKEAPVK